MPKISELAFWKKDGERLAKAPPPPALHFTPDSTGNPAVADSDSSEPADSFNYPSESLAQNQSNGSSTKPIRSPYSIDSSNSDSSSDSDFENAMAGKIKTKLPDWNSEPSSQGSSLNQISKSLANSIEQGRAQANDFASKAAATANSLVKDASNDFGGDWKNDFALPANNNMKGLKNSSMNALGNAIDSAKDNVNQFAASANEMKSAATEKFNNALEDANDFAANNDFAVAAKNTKAKLQNGITQANDALANAMDNANQFAAAGVSKAKSSGLELKNKIQSGVQKQSQSTQNGLSQFVAQTKPTKQHATEPLQKPMNQLGNALSQTQNNLQAALAEAESKAPPITPKSLGSSSPDSNFDVSPTPYPQVAQNPQLAQNNPLVPQFSSQQNAPSNSLRSSMEPLRTESAPSVAPYPTTPKAAPATGSPYPTTPYNAIAPRNQMSQTSPMTGSYNAQVGYSSAGEQGMVRNAGGFESQSNLRSLGDDSVLLPESLRTGTGSFAPGSVKELMPKSK